MPERERDGLCLSEREREHAIERDRERETEREGESERERKRDQIMVLRLVRNHHHDKYNKLKLVLQVVVSNLSGEARWGPRKHFLLLQYPARCNHACITYHFPHDQHSLLF